MIIHVVQEGETIFSIAGKYGVTESNILYHNELSENQPLLIGQALLILIPELTHEVVSGDTLLSISRLYNITSKSLLRNNPWIMESGAIYPGEILVIRYQGQRDTPLRVDGFFYPYLPDFALKKRMLYLTHMMAFSYGFRPDGTLIPLDDEVLLFSAFAMNIDPVLVLTSLSEDGTFDNNLVRLLLTDTNLQNTLIENLDVITVSKGYRGINMDFEFIPADLKEAYVNLLERMQTHFSTLGIVISVDLPPKEYDDQPGLLYEGIDYSAIGKVVDEVLLMTYEWGYTYSEPMAVAPINKVRQILDYAIRTIPREKIELGIPNYGYDWPLPYVKGETRARTIGNIEAIELAAMHNAQIYFDDIAMSPYFRYTIDGIEHEVWFEDIRSLKARLDLIEEYGLTGIGIWNMMRSFRQGWLLLTQQYSVE